MRQSKLLSGFPPFVRFLVIVSADVLLSFHGYGLFVAEYKLRLSFHLFVIRTRVCRHLVLLIRYAECTAEYEWRTYATRF